jgi:chromosome segregation ATPase
MTTAIILIISALWLVSVVVSERKIRALKRELADMTDDRDVQAFKVRNAENVMQGLQDDLATRIQEGIEQVAFAQRQAARLDEFSERLSAAEADADRLAPFVANFIADMDVIAKKLGTIDEKPLDLSCEREAIRLHEEAVKLRIK